MSTPGARRINLLLVAILLLISILLEQYWIARFFPWIGGFGGFRPMIVFLDIPLALPNIDWIPVSILFVVFYSIVISPEMSRNGQRGLVGKKIWNALAGWWLLLICVLAGGGLYYLVEGYLPPPVRNGIDSFGIRGDLTLPMPYNNVIHLHGSMILLVFFLLGLYLMAKRSAILTPAEAQALAETAAILQAPAPTTAREPAPAVKIQAPAPPSRPVATIKTTKSQPRAETQIAEPPVAKPVITEPPTCRYTTPPPIAVIMPRPAPGINKMHPCVVGGVYPLAERAKATP
jgi:hypothetical protein